MLAACQSYLLELTMAIQDIWRENLKALIKTEGDGRHGLRAVALTAHLSEEYLHQIVTGKLRQTGKPHEVGKAAARKIALAFANGRPDDWFDSPIDTARPLHQDAPIHVVQSTIASSNRYAIGSAFAQDLAATFDKLVNDDDRQDVYIQCITLIRTRLDASREPPPKQANGGGA